MLEVLTSKHPEAVHPKEEDLEEYSLIPEMVTLDITADTVMKVTTKLSGAAGPGGIDSMALQQWLLTFGVSSNLQRETVAHSLDGWQIVTTHPRRSHIVPSCQT